MGLLPSSAVDPYWTFALFVLLWLVLFVLAAAGAVASFVGRGRWQRLAGIPGAMPWLFVLAPVVVLALPWLPESGYSPLLSIAQLPLLLFWYLYRSNCDPEGSRFLAIGSAWLLFPSVALLVWAFVQDPTDELPTAALVSTEGESLHPVPADPTEALFVRNCQICHRMDLDGAGPGLLSRMPRWKNDSVSLAAWLKDPKVVDPSWPPMPPAPVSREEALRIAGWLVRSAAVPVESP